MYLKKLDSLTTNEIQKYNGKSVKSKDLVNLVLADNKVIVAYKTSAIRASDDIKLRAFLKKYRIQLKRFKRKDIVFCKRYVSYPKEKSQHFFDFLNFMEGFGLILSFDDLLHFFFFENYLTPKLTKFKFFPVLIKNNNQYLFFNSDLFNLSKSLVDSSKRDLQLINSFFFFQFSVVRNFMFFYIYLKFQTSIYNKI